MNSEIEYVLPPGTFEDHPVNTYNHEILGVSLMYEHRFAFYYWMKWTNILRDSIPPVLISLDWHQDLVYPAGDEYDELRAINQNDYREVGIFTAYKLSPLNHCQILSAAYLNLISDVYVLCKQDGDDDEFDFEDYLANNHKVKVFYKIEDLLTCIQQETIDSVYLDVDLDYFTESEDSCGGDANVKLVSDEEVGSMVALRSPLMEWILPKLKGMTIALEPQYYGGMRKSHYLFNLLDEYLFDPPLLNPNSRWKDK